MTTQSKLDFHRSGWTTQGTEETKRALTDTDGALAFLLAGRAVVTLRSKKTGTRFTYRVRRSAPRDPSQPIPRLFFVDVLVGSDNNGDYQFIGTLRDNQFRWSPKSRLCSDIPSIRAFAWTIDHFGRGIYPCDLEVWHEGRCGRCGRRLTVPESIASGLGPECAGRLFS